MTIKELINAGLCALANVLGTEIGKTCVSAITKGASIWAIAPGESFRQGEDLEAEKARLILAKKLVVMRGVTTFEENGSEDATETLADDTQGVTNEGKYKFLATFTNGMFFNKALHSLKGFRKWNIVIVTQEGIWGTLDSTGGLTGFTTGMIQPAKLTIGSNSTIQKEGLMFQFLERSELDVDFAFIPDTTARKQKGVTQIAISFVNAPADTDTTLTAKAVYAQNTSEAFTGIDYTKFLNTVNSAASNPTAGDDSTTTGTFVLTVAALSTNDTGVLQLGSGNSTVIVGADGDYYQSNVLSYTV